MRQVRAVAQACPSQGAGRRASWRRPGSGV